MSSESNELKPDRNLGVTATTRADLDAVRGGDGQALERLWRRFEPTVQMLVRGKVRQGMEPLLRHRLDEEIDDIVQDIAQDVVEHVRSFEYRGPGSLLAWMYTIAQNRVRDRVDYWRAGRRHPRREGPSLALQSASPTTNAQSGVVPQYPGPGPVTNLTAIERREQVAHALAALPERQHTIVLLRCYGGASWSEIATAVGATSGDAVRVEFSSKIVPAIASLLASR